LTGLLFLNIAHGKEIVIAQVAPLSGPLAINGKGTNAGIRLYFDSVNAQGGVNGTRLRLVAFDDAYQPEKTVRLFKEAATKENVIAFVGTHGVNNLEALAKDGFLEKNNIPLVGAMTGASSLVGVPGMFVIKASYRDEIDSLFNQLSKSSIKRVAILYQADALGKDVLAGAEAAASKYSITLVARASYERNTTNVGNAVAALKQAAPQVIFLGATTNAAIEFVKQYRAQIGGATLYGLSIIDSSELLKKLGPDVARGYAFSMVTPNLSESNFALICEYQKLSKASGDPDLTGRSLEGYIAAKTLVAALRTGASTPEAVSKALLSMHKLDLGGYFIDFGVLGHFGSSYVDFAMFGGEGRIVK
jgi:ABC-type branched-subunit amino acid transport system substrate-binding protein